MEEDRLPGEKPQRIRKPKAGSRRECVDQLLALGVPSAKSIIAYCTKIRVLSTTINQNKTRYAIQVTARYLTTPLDSGLVMRDTFQEAAGVAVGIIVKSMEMIDNGERCTRYDDGGSLRKPTGKPLRPESD